MQQERNRWKWYLLRITALMLGGIALLILAALLFSLTYEAIEWWSEGFWIFVFTCIWSAAVFHASYVQLSAVAFLLKTYPQPELMVPVEKMRWALGSATVALLVILFAVGSIVYSLLQIQEQSQQVLNTEFWSTLLIQGFLAILAVVNYLLSIKAYFELRFMRMAAEETLLMQLNNPMAKPQY